MLGCCGGCDRPVRGRHPDQTSDALGAAGTMLGSPGVGVGRLVGLWDGDVGGQGVTALAELGLAVTAGGITLALERVAGDATGTWNALRQALRASQVVSPDETGWRIDAERGWLTVGFRWRQGDRL